MSISLEPIERVLPPDAPLEATIRAASRADLAQLSDMLLRLGERSRYLRYHAPWHMTPQTARREAERMLDPDGGRLSLLVVRPCDDGHEVLAVGELAPAGDGSAELAILVRDDHQRRGLGVRLGRSLMARAQAMGVGQICADVLAENMAARRLLRCLGLNRQIDAGYGTLRLGT